MKTNILLFSLLTILSIAPANAQNGPASYGVGGNSCGQYVQAVEQSRLGNYLELNKYATWRDGYLTAESIRLERSFGDIRGSEVWLENYCRANPLKIYTLAVAFLIGDLINNK